MPADRFRVVRLDELERSPARPEWIPVRKPLGIASFGVNAWSGAAGTDLVPDHDETATGHEELYVVTDGHARFTLDGDLVEAPAGTVVHVPDPATRRGAVAGAGGATILTVGAKPGAPFRVSPWEVNSEVFPLFDRGEFAAAKRLLDVALVEQPESANVLYNLACAEAQLGESETALDHLRRALALEPALGEHVAEDQDLAPLRELPGFPG